MSRRILLTALVLTLAFTFSACSRSDTGKAGVSKVPADASAKVTFLELGSTSCIPCKKMQPVMKSIETRYAGQVKVIFHDVLKDRSKSQEFGIKLIPTQIFLDPGGKEIMRHEGFFAEEEIDKFLKGQGLTPQS